MTSSTSPVGRSPLAGAGSSVVQVAPLSELDERVEALRQMILSNSPHAAVVAKEPGLLVHLVKRSPNIAEAIKKIVEDLKKAGGNRRDYISELLPLIIKIETSGTSPSISPFTGDALDWLLTLAEVLTPEAKRELAARLTAGDKSHK